MARRGMIGAAFPRRGARRWVSWAVSAFLAIAAVFALPSAAYADPAGCGHSTDFYWSLSGGGYLLYTEGEGGCSLSQTLTLRVQVKVNLWPSDVVIGQNDHHTTGTYWTRTVSSCDGGQTKEYYGRSYFTQNVTWVDDGYVVLQVC